MRLPVLSLVALVLIAGCAAPEDGPGPSLTRPVEIPVREGHIDVNVTLAPDGTFTTDAPEGILVLNNSTPGERFVFDLALTKDYTAFEFRAKGFGFERPRQLRPTLDVPETEYPLFNQFPHERIWQVDGPGTVFHANGTGDDIILRLGLPGPGNKTLILQRDATPPTFTLGEMENLTHVNFYMETRTDELALADLQVRKAGSSEWIQNPTPSYHFRQRFPVQGLDADSDYEARVVFHDWAENEAVSDVWTFRTPAAPVFPEPTITPLQPAPNSTVTPGFITIRARVTSAGPEIHSDGVRMFFDLKEVSQALRFEGDVVIYTPTEPLKPGLHRVTVEVTDVDGGKGSARWSFTVSG